jgi:hypothetical protein
MRRINMDAEEEHIRRRIEERERALRQKVELLKARIEQIKRMADIKAMVYRRPSLMVAGSVLTGFLVRKLGSRRHAENGAYRAAARAPHPEGYPDKGSKRTTVKLKDALVAVLAGVASRTATNVLSDLTKQLIPGKYDVRRAERTFRSSRYNP